MEGPAVDSRSIAGSDIVKKISKPKPKVENFREKRGQSALFQKFGENAGEAWPRKGAETPSYIDRIPRGAAAHVLAKETSTTFQHLPSSLIPIKEIQHKRNHRCPLETT